MSGPQHLWSGDWEVESSARRDELAAGRNRAQPPIEPEPEPERPAPPRRPRRPPLLHRLRTALVARRRELRVAGLVAVLILLFAGAAYAVTSALGGGSSNTNSPAAASGSQAWLGIDVATSASGGVRVVNVIPGSPAYWAGMEAGDVITRINGKPVYKPSDVTSTVDGKHPGDRIQIQFQGSGTVYTKHIALATPPAGYP
jgi:membrane-associated protease RseP (regulator of RpoE activity)